MDFIATQLNVCACAHPKLIASKFRNTRQQWQRQIQMEFNSISFVRYPASINNFFDVTDLFVDRLKRKRAQCERWLALEWPSNENSNVHVNGEWNKQTLSIWDHLEYAVFLWNQTVRQTHGTSTILQMFRDHFLAFHHFLFFDGLSFCIHMKNEEEEYGKNNKTNTIKNAIHFTLIAVIRYTAAVCDR